MENKSDIYVNLKEQLVTKVTRETNYQEDLILKVVGGVVETMEEVIMGAYTGPINPSTYLREEIGFDSLCERELHLGIEDYLDIQISESDFFNKLYVSSKNKEVGPTVSDLVTKILGYIN